LSDKDSCGEDLFHSAHLAMRIAPVACRGCEDYHFLASARRLTGRASGVESDRPATIEIIRKRIVEWSKTGAGNFDIVIVGSTDTGVLATCAHAAYGAGSAAYSRVRFTVLDLCRTPLELCRDFAERHQFALATEAVDVIETDNVYPADLVVHHSLFRHIPPDRHTGALKKFASWLKPGGRIVFSIGLRVAEARPPARARRSEVHDRLRAMVESGALKLNESKEALDRRLAARADADHTRWDPDAEEVGKLFLTAGLTTLSSQHIASGRQFADGSTFLNDRLLAVLAAVDPVHDG
jgi:hypothetical protein